MYVPQVQKAAGSDLASFVKLAPLFLPLSTLGIHSKITLKEKGNTLDLKNVGRNGRSDSDLDDLDEGESQPRWTRCKTLDVCDQSNLLLCSLTDKHRNAIRMVRKIKYFVARRKFQQVLNSLFFWKGSVQ